MNFRLKKSLRFRPRRGHGREVALVALVFIAAIIIFTYFGGALGRVLSPLWRSSNVVSRNLSSAVESLRGKDALIAENTALKEKLASDEELIVSLRSIASSRDDLLAAFGRPAEKALPATVLVHPPKTPYDILVLDAGSEEGVVAGSSVVMPEGPGLGSVTDVFAQSSRVRLYSTAGERTGAVLERGGIPVTLVGRGGGNLEFSVPRDTNVVVGDRVISADLASRLLGVVGSIDLSPTDSEKTVYVRGPANLSTIRYVLIRE